MKPLIKRILAYIFDLMAVTFVAGVISMSVLNPNYDKSVEVSEKYQARLLEIQEEMFKKEDAEALELFNEFIDTYKVGIRKINRLSIYEEIILMVMLVLYFGLFAYIFDGETVGKRMMHLRTVAVSGERASMWQLVLRMLILYGVPLTALNLIFSYVLGAGSFFGAYIILSVASFLLEVALLALLFIRKDNRSIHDLIAKTKVIEVERK